MFDTDCFPGSRCLKPPGQLYGVCAGGLFPGNDHDREPVRDPFDPWDARGETCQFDLDCGIGNRCLKRAGALEGVCVGRRRIGDWFEPRR